MSNTAPRSTTADTPINHLSFSHLVAVTTMVLGVALVITASIANLNILGEANMQRAAGIIVFSLGLWATGVVPEFFTSLVFLFLCAVFAIAPPGVIFSGFQASAMWLVFGGLVIGLAVHETGLAKRLVHAMVAYIPANYFGILASVIAAGGVLAFVIPSALSRAVLITPIAMELAARLGFAEGSKGRTGIVLAAGMGTTLPAFAILPSNVPNLVLSASAESLFNIHFEYGHYLALNFPVLGVFSMLATLGLNWLFFREAPTRDGAPSQSGGVTGNERKLAVILMITVALWATDFIHGVSPAWVAMGAALLCAAPGVGVLKTQDLVKKINYAPWLFVAGVVGLGAVASHSGLGATLGKGLLALTGQNIGGGLAGFSTLVAVGMSVAFATTLPAVPAIMTPLATTLSSATGWPIDTVLMAQVPTWVLIPLPYLAPPILVTLSMAGITARRAAPLMIVYFILGVVIALPLHFYWARYLGVFM
ncbi:SLC13 family permease [Varunaivibrio sulfuroxidans]|uniref:Di/tricarboxylate transporter n=1 Tax=Varunaivibrio sulfuroxidans TaxID=1773489 RepID=A0A4V2UNA8_9PROT|nr:SLC13 family permease [Varunaivibrio sulfuroxidans]TCS61301.1 di/tricarboxylate transporter [Varunaivibrio sulfuroxidans]WES31083.1 SLC13 family permease [Varunaivibrio sulfuroxidans]